MKKRLLTLMLVVVLIGSSVPAASAVTSRPTKEKTPPLSNEDDGYRPDSDPLPEWLLLPDGVNENSLSFDGNQKKKLTIKESGNDRWEIIATGNGAAITYTRFEGNDKQFLIKTTKDYSSITAYVNNGRKLQKTKSINPDDYFDNSKDLSLVEDPGFTFFKPVSANEGRESLPVKKVSKKRVGTKLTKRQINKLNHSVGFKGKDASIANRVAYYESGGGNTKAVACENGTATGFNPPGGGPKGVKYCKDHGASGAGRGLYQISSDFHKNCTNKCAFSPVKNAKYAHNLRKKYGWTQWCSYGGCGSNDPNPAGRGPAMRS